MSDKISPTKTSLVETFEISSQILRNLELNEIPLTNVALKASRLARLLNDFDMQKVMQYEAGGYPSGQMVFRQKVGSWQFLRGENLYSLTQKQKRTTSTYILRLLLN